MPTLIINLIALLAYVVVSIMILQLIRNKQLATASSIVKPTALAALFHGVGVYLLLFLSGSPDFSLVKMLSAIFWVVNCLVLVRSLNKPLHILFVFLAPLSALAIACSLVFDIHKTTELPLSPGISAHVMFSILAYSLITIAMFQALLWYWQNQKLKQRDLEGIAGLLPPLQTMEALIFEMLWIGQGFLTLAILLGILYIDNIFAQHLAHKTVLSVIAWLVFSGLLWGRKTQGWRGKTAVKWVVVGFFLLMLAYFGSKLALEVIL